jgi:hypothetical protein
MLREKDFTADQPPFSPDIQLAQTPFLCLPWFSLVRAFSTPNRSHSKCDLHHGPKARFKVMVFFAATALKYLAGEGRTAW